MKLSTISITSCSTLLLRALLFLLLIMSIGCGEIVGDENLGQLDKITDAGADASGREIATPLFATVQIPVGTGAPGCEESDACFLPTIAVVGIEGAIQWSNDDSAAHTVTHGTPKDGPGGEFDSGLLLSEGEFFHVFDTPGEYPYFCMVHPWMTGIVQVKK